MDIKVGFGFDVHRLEEGAELWLGGVNVPATKGAVGHSDADVLIHSICDALLGAINLHDIGYHFPNTDPQYKGIQSIKLLKEVCRMVREQGYLINNIDSTISLQEPKIAPFIPDMQRTLAEGSGLTEDDISIKATTTEKLGFSGRREGVAAYSVVLVKKA